MAHELTEQNGRYEFAYVGEDPWHHVGTRLESVATSAEMLRAAGLGWVVQTEAIALESSGERIPGWVANVRSDTRDVLGVVSTEYQPIQNGDAFAFMDNLVDAATAMYHTAGSIRRGRLVFALAKLPDSFMVVPDDVIDQYLLLINGHDGTAALHLRFTPVRVVCANTLAAAIGGRSLRTANTAAHQITIRHIGNIQMRVSEAQRALGIARRYFTVAGETYRALAARDITQQLWTQFVQAFMPMPTAPGPTLEHDRAVTQEIHERLAVLFEQGRGNTLPRVKGTAWAAFNAATEWIDHVRTARLDGTFRKHAPEAALFGVGEVYRQRAMQAAVSLLT